MPSLYTRISPDAVRKVALRRVLCVLSWFPLLSLIACSTATAAVPSQFAGLIQLGATQGHAVPISNNLFLRQQYDAAGALVTFQPWVRDPESQEWIYSVAPGETFMWIWRDVSSGQPLAFNSVRYLGGDDLCWSDGSCGPSVSWWSALVLQCMEEHDRVRVEVYHDGAFLGADTLRPTRFVPRLATTDMASAIEPKRTRLREGGTTEVAVVVTDDLGCSRPIAGARVRVSATIAQDATNQQPYLTQNEIGTGKFSTLGFDAVVNPDDATQAGTVIEGFTDWQGRFKARYQAQAHGAEETITIEVTRPASGSDPALVAQPVERQLRIAIPNLVRITHDSAPLAFAVLDHGTPRCHGSHRQGIDIDLNATDRLVGPPGAEPIGLNMRETQHEFNGLEWTLLTLLDEWAGLYDGTAHHGTRSIHYRFPN
ncbi:hypothetical protein HUS23_02745 [Ectothiorhodospiraceae bacterium 2226]|nr:hypothetical protein HUS23_02745 [Ectothiorhodospiraceae bacterium 2226]